MTPTTMRAWRMHRYGGADVMSLDSMSVPAPAAGQVLVRMRAASVNPIDWKIREGYLKAMLQIQFPRVPGRDSAGTVEAVGAGVTDFSPGDRVLGLALPVGDGTHAEFALLPASGCARIPGAVTDAEAAALGVAGLSAYIPLVENAKLGSGQRVLIHAGAGGVGTAAIQIARHLGAEVITTCSSANAPFCKELGAARCIDYGKEDFAKEVSDCDVVFDSVGGEVHQRSARVLKPGGVMVYINAQPVQPVARTDIRVLPSMIQATRERLDAMLALAASGALRAQVGRVFKLEEAQAAYAMVQTGHVRGKLVLSAA